MAYNNYLETGLDNRPAFTLGGTKTLLLVNQTSIQHLTYDNGLVDSITLRAGDKWNPFLNLGELTYSLTPEISKNGTIYGIEIGFTVSIQTDAKNRLFDTMRETDLTAIVQDRNNRWWIMGVDQPLRLTQQEQQVNKDGNQYSVKLTTKQRDNVRQLTTAFVTTLTSDDFNPVLDTIDGVTLDMQVATSNGGSSGSPGTPGSELPNNFLGSISGPPSGYVILDTIGIVSATAGSTIRLPQVARNGQQHTVKDYTGLASQAAITVDGNGRNIDGTSTPFRITTNYGAATFTFNNNAWLVTSFVN